MSDLTSMALRPPPHDRVAEQNVLAAVMLQPQCHDDIRRVIDVEDFFFHEHQLIFRAAVALGERDLPVTPYSVAHRIVQDGRSADVGGVKYIAELLEVNPTGIGWEYYAGQVSSAARRRRLIQVNTEMARDASDGTEPVDDLIARYETKLFAVAANRRADGERVTLRQAMAESLDQMEERQSGKDTGIVPTGYLSLDEIIGGYKPGDLIVVAGRPGSGKTASQMNVALEVIARPNTPALFFSQEMARTELAARVLAIRASVPLHRITGTKPVSADEASRLAAAKDLDTPSDLWIDDRSHLSAAQVARAVRAAQRQHGVKLVVVDYLQRMAHDKKAGDTQAAQIGDTVKAMKTLARECKIPVVCLAQLNRDAANAEPTMAQLKGSGDIEQEADVIILLHAETPEPESPRQRVRFIVEKQRNGPVQVTELDYVRPYTRFEEPRLL